ncbi:MAG: polysaccharide export protein [Methylotenera sp.]|nr:polysaccharide export protein [Methylotenera sp.]
MLFIAGTLVNAASAQEANYILGAGDVVKISVFGNADLTLETRISEADSISFPLIGQVKIGGLSTFSAEKRIAEMLEKGGFIKSPQVNILVTQFQSKLVSVLGSVYKPGRYPLERTTNLADLLALVGGVTPDGSDLVTVTNAAGKTEYDLQKVVGKADGLKSIIFSGGEVVFVHSRDISVMGQVLKPGKYAVVGGVRTVADFLSVAGGITATGSDTVTVTTVRDGKINRFDVDVDSLFRTGDNSTNIELASGDSIYVPNAPMFYIYGEVQRPGSYRIARGMTVVQALVQGGGTTLRGTQRGIKLNRKNAKGETVELRPALTDLVQQDDVLYVQESLF